jgi:hypothetical protein
MTYIYNPQQLESSENTFITALAFATITGQLTATRNDGVELTTDLDGRYVTENTRTTSATFNTSDGILTLNQTDPVGTVTVDLDGRFPTENTHLNTATLGVDNVLSLGMVNPTSTITVDLSDLSDLNTHLDSASLTESNVLQLNMVNPESTITVDLDGMVTGDFLPIDFTNSFAGDLNYLVQAGVYSVSTTAVNTPPELQGNEHFVSVYSDRVGAGQPTSCVQIWHTGMNQSNGLNPNTRMWMRIFSYGTMPIVSQWQEINNGGLNGYLRGEMTATGRDFNAPRYRQSGYYFVGNVNSETQGWTNGPDYFPNSQFNVLKTIMTGVSSVDLSYGNGYQELSTATYDAPNNHVRTWKRAFEASSTVENYSSWFEVYHQGVPIQTQVLDIYNMPDTRSVIDVKGKRVIDVSVSNLSYGISTLQNGVEGQVITFIKTSYNGMVTINTTGNINTPNGGTSRFVMRYHRGGSFIKKGSEWYPLFSNSTS